MVTTPVPTPANNDNTFDCIPAMYEPPRVDEFALQFHPHSWSELAAKYPNTLAVHDPHHDDEQLTFSALHNAMLCFASGLQALGLMPGDIVSLFSENSARWLIADQAVMLNGAADAVCGQFSTLLLLSQ